MCMRLRIMLDPLADPPDQREVPVEDIFRLQKLLIAEAWIEATYFGGRFVPA